MTDRKFKRIPPILEGLVEDLMARFDELFEAVVENDGEDLEAESEKRVDSQLDRRILQAHNSELLQEREQYRNELRGIEIELQREINHLAALRKKIAQALSTRGDESAPEDGGGPVPIRL